MIKKKQKYRENSQVMRGMILNLIVSSPALLGAGLILTTKGPLYPLILSLGFFCAGISGLIVVIRKEIPTSILTIKGRSAVIQGSIFMILCWGLALYFAGSMLL